MRYPLPLIPIPFIYGAPATVPTVTARALFARTGELDIKLMKSMYKYNKIKVPYMVPNACRIFMYKHVTYIHTCFGLIILWAKIKVFYLLQSTELALFERRVSSKM
jgi:hypothetical protein